MSILASSITISIYATDREERVADRYTKRKVATLLTSNAVVELIEHTSTVRLYPNVPSPRSNTAFCSSQSYALSALCLYRSEVYLSPIFLLFSSMSKYPSLKPRSIEYANKPVALDSRKLPLRPGKFITCHHAPDVVSCAWIIALMRCSKISSSCFRMYAVSNMSGITSSVVRRPRHVQPTARAQML